MTLGQGPARTSLVGVWTTPCPVGEGGLGALQEKSLEVLPTASHCVGL
jgi:hypothetical protein